MNPKSTIVKIFGKEVGEIVQNIDGIFFEFNKDFLNSGLNLFPTAIDLKPGLIKANSSLLKKESFQGLHGPFSDSLPGRFGNELLKKHFEGLGFNPTNISPIDKLLYVGKAGMGALEYYPTQKKEEFNETPLEIRKLVDQSRKVIQGDISDNLSEIMEVSSGAGGARAKALIGWDRAINKVVSGARDLSQNYEHYMIKFDGVVNNIHGWGAVEYTYSEIAKKCGITMSETSLLEHEGLYHFMTKRFDRLSHNQKAHFLSLSALTENDFNEQRSFDYDTLFRVTASICNSTSQNEQQFRRMVFNLFLVNQDDHVKNFSFLYKDQKIWELSPAYDLCFADNGWCSEHQMTIQGKLGSKVTYEDLQKFAQKHGVKNFSGIIDQISNAAKEWELLADKNKVPEKLLKYISASLKERADSINSIPPSPAKKRKNKSIDMSPPQQKLKTNS